MTSDSSITPFLKAISVAALWVPSPPQVVNDESERLRIISERHDNKLAGHPGQQKTFELISRDFSWPGMRAMIYS